MGLDLITYWKTHNYQKVILLNLKMSLFAWWPNFFFLLLVLFKIYFRKLNSEIWDFQWQNFECNTSFYRLDLVTSFSNYQNRSMLWFYCYWLQCCGFFCFLTASNALATSGVTFSDTGMIVFFLFFDLIFLW